MKRILITGSTSTVARAIGGLLSQQHSVSYAGRREADYPLDLASVDTEVFAQARFDVVIHAAADFGGEGGEALLRAETVNALGALQVCRIAKAVHAQHMVQISSASAHYSAGEPYYNAYALSKRHGDELAQLYCAQEGLPLSILRPTQIYDAAGHCRGHQGLFYTMLDKAEQGEDITLYGSNDALRDYLFLEDFCAIIARVIAQGVTGTYDCPGNAAQPLSAIAHTALRVFGKGGDVRFLADKPDIPDIPLSPSTTLYNIIGYHPATDLAVGVQRIKTIRGAV